MADGHTSKRGFARMDAGKQREIASKGGRAAHEKGTAHRFTSEEAREAGRKGGERSRSRHSGSHPEEPQSEPAGAGENVPEHIPDTGRRDDENG